MPSRTPPIDLFPYVSARLQGTVATARWQPPASASRIDRPVVRLVDVLLLALQLQFSPEMSFARIGLMGSAPRRPCEDIGVRDAPLGKLRGDTADFLDRPADQERRFGRDR